MGRILAIAGPSGSGKTTVARQLAATFCTYTEATEENPYLDKMLRGAADFDATANQQWFLQRIGEFISSAARKEHLVIDQDPAAIVHVYGRLFRDDNLIDNEQFNSLVSTLNDIEALMAQWENERHILLLDAPAEILHHRVQQARGKGLTPPLQWFANVRHCFLEFQALAPKAIVISTTDHGPVEIAQQGRELLLAN